MSEHLIEVRTTFCRRITGQREAKEKSKRSRRNNKLKCFHSLGISDNGFLPSTRPLICNGCPVRICHRDCTPGQLEDIRKSMKEGKM